MIITELNPVVVRFTINGFSDALNFASQAERDQYDQAQIEAMCQARYDAWAAAVAAMAPAPIEDE